MDAPETKKKSPIRIVAAVGVAAALAGGAWMFLRAGEEDTDDAQVAADLVPVGTRVAGQLVKVAVKENQPVHKGDLIAQIDDADYNAKVKQAEAELATAQAQAAEADAKVQVTEATSRGGLSSARAALSGSSVGVGTAEAQVAAARAGLERAQADLHKSEMDLDRAKELRAANAVPQERLDNAQMANDSAKAQMAQAKANLSLAEETRRAAEERVNEMRGRVSQSEPINAQMAASRAAADLAHAKVKSAEAMLDLARLSLSYTRVTAPTDGVTSKLAAHEGALLAPNQPIVTLVPSQTYVIANFKETQIGKMKAGQKAIIKIDAFPGRKFEGQVESLSGGTGASFSLLPPDNASGNFVKVVQRVPVRINWVNAPSDVTPRAGLSADVTVEVGR